MRRIVHSLTTASSTVLRAVPALLFFALVLLLHEMAHASLRPVVVDSDRIRATGRLEDDGRRLRFTTAGGRELSLLLHPGPDEILNPSFDGRLHPFSGEQVQTALAEMRPLVGPDLGVRIYCLPGLPEGVESSFCVGDEVFLSPAVAPAAVEVVASTVVHEIGHALQHARLPASAERGWELYRRLRGLRSDVHHDSAEHRNRPREIFAEDFRRLYGGPRANYSGSHENHDLADPAEVEGVVAFFGGVVAGAYSVDRPIARVSNHPNPFNPRTTIEVRLRPEMVALGGSVRVDVFDLRGRRVRSLGTLPMAEVVRVGWDGSDERGRPVASGRYSYRVRLGGESIVGSMLLLQ